jgi:hypothetical protein
MSEKIRDQTCNVISENMKECLLKCKTNEDTFVLPFTHEFSHFSPFWCESVNTQIKEMEKCGIKPNIERFVRINEPCYIRYNVEKKEFLLK